MNPIPEEFLHYIWKYKLFSPDYLHYNNSKVEVVDTGLHNHSSGPDFFNARIKIGNTIWAGNVEVHVKASDWIRHGHHKDPAYDSVILHVVYELDLAVYRINGDEIPAIRLSFNPRLINTYYNLVKWEGHNRTCVGHLKNMDRIFFRDWLGKLCIERLEEKTSALSEILKNNHYDWEDGLYKSLAMSFGMKLNSEPFRLLAECVPLRFILRNRESFKTVNAAFFGQAGFLDELISDDPYYSMLQKEFQSITGLLPPALPGKHLWKFMRSRPAGFPTARIPQLANIIVKSFPLFEKIIEAANAREIEKILENGLKNYWVDFFLYGKPGRRKISRPGKETIDLLIINSIVPIIFLYGQFRMNEKISEQSITLLEELPTEKNSITRQWSDFGLDIKNAFDSQAVIHLETRYCLKKRCIDCLFGNRIMMGKVKDKR